MRIYAKPVRIAAELSDFYLNNNNLKQYNFRDGFLQNSMSLHTAFTNNQVAGTKEIFHQRVPMLNKPHRSFNLKFISLNLRDKYTHLYTLAFTNMRREYLFTLCFSLWDKHTPEGMLEQNQEGCPANTYAARTLETRHRKSKTTAKAQTLQTTTD